MFLPFGSNSTAPKDSKCCYWSSTINNTIIQSLHFHAKQSGTNWSYEAYRYVGMLIRPI